MDHEITGNRTFVDPSAWPGDAGFIYQNIMSSLRKSGVNDSGLLVTFVACEREAL
jgi:hypothetical protein